MSSARDRAVRRAARKAEEIEEQQKTLRRVAERWRREGIRQGGLVNHVYRIGKAKPITGEAFQKKHPALWEAFRLDGVLSPGEERVVKLPRKRGKRVRVRHVHPRELTPTLRERICGPGLTGKARQLFVEEGLTLKEQVYRAQPAVEAAIAADTEWWYEHHPEERARKEARKEAQKEKKERKKKASRVDLSGMLTPKEVAEQAGISPTEVRKFLRAKKVGKRGGRYAFKEQEAAKIAKAAAKYYQEEEA